MIRWFDSRSIRTRVLISVLVPLVIVTATLGYYMTVARLRDVDQQLMQRGTALVHYLAPLSEFGMFADNRDMLEPVLRGALAEPDVQTVAILDPDKNVLLHRNRDLESATSNSIGTTYLQESSLLFTAPIRSSQISISDYPDSDEEIVMGADGRILGWVELSLSREASDARQVEILRNSILMVLAGLLLSALMALFIGRSVTGPIGHIIKTVERLRRGQLGARVPVGFGGELATLAEGINTMAVTIGNAQERLTAEVSQATSDLRSTVKSLENRNRELDEARRVALQAGEAKAEFLAKMSHEIRTPLNAVIGFANLLEKTRQTDQQYEYTRTVSQAATSLLSVIDDILNISRLESGALVIEPALFDLHDSLENVVTMLSAAAHEKGLELVLLLHSDVPARIFADGSRINQVVTNLLNNAIKFTESGHVVVEVSVVELDGRQLTICIEVSDTGIGLGDKEAKSVFQPFRQASSAISRRYGGTGLGLSISRKVVDLLGGDMGVKSTPGQGSTFWFTLPARMSETADQRMPRHLEGVKVLVYDSNDYSRRSLRNRFIGWGASVFNMGEWSRAHDFLHVSQAGNEPCQLLVLGLPSREGDNTIIGNLLEATAAWPDLPVLILVGNDTAGFEVTLPDDRSIQILSKPVLSNTLLRAVRNVLELPQGPAGDGRTSSAPGGAVTGSDLQGMRVLVAEDNRFNRELIIKLLTDMGVSVQMAVDGREAVQCAVQELFDLILMDIHMPEMGGVHAAQLIRAGLNRQTPIVALTADVFADRDQCLDATGIDDCIYKPVNDDKLSAVLHKWVNRRRSVTRLGSLPGVNPPEEAGASHEDRNGGIPGDLRRLLHEELGVQLQGLRSACSDRDVDRMRDHAHQLKGLAGYFGLSEFHEKTGLFQQAVTASEQARIDAILGELEAMANDIMKNQAVSGE